MLDIHIASNFQKIVSSIVKSIVEGPLQSGPVDAASEC